MTTTFTLRASHLHRGDKVVAPHGTSTVTDVKLLPGATVALRMVGQVDGNARWTTEYLSIDDEVTIDLQASPW